MSTTRIAGALENEMSVTSLELNIDSKWYNTRCCKPDDYVKLIESTSGQVFGVCEIQGLRKTQEDRLCVSVNAVKGFEKFSFEEQEVLCLETFRELQDKYGDNLYVGSTGCVATAWIDQYSVLRVLTANLGDSSAYAVILNRDNQLVNHERLNLLHKPTDAAERERIFHNGGYVRESRLNLDLSLSRAFGDKRFENRGISHIPEVSLFNLPLADGERAYIVVACDGMDNIYDKIGRLVSENSNLTLAAIANKLVGEALIDGSSDNISAAIFMPGTVPASAAVFDGHGGSVVAEHVGNNFYPTFAATTAKLKESGWYAEARSRIDAERISRQWVIEESKRKKESNLQLVKQKLDSYLEKFNSTAGFEVFTKLLHTTDMSYTAPREYVMVFQSDTYGVYISELETLASKHDMPIYYWGLYTLERDAKKRQYIASFTENDEIPPSFDAFMADALPYLAFRGLIQMGQQRVLTAPGAPGFFLPQQQVVPERVPQEWQEEHEPTQGRDIKWLL